MHNARYVLRSGENLDSYPGPLLPRLSLQLAVHSPPLNNAVREAKVRGFAGGNAQSMVVNAAAS